MEHTVMPKTTRITLETETLLVIRRAKAVSAWCPGCLAEVDVVTLDNDSLAEPSIAVQIQERLSTNKLHSWQTANGSTQICLTSLFRCFELEVTERFWPSNGIPLDETRRKRS